MIDRLHEDPAEHIPFPLRYRSFHLPMLLVRFRLGIVTSLTQFFKLDLFRTVD